MLADPETLRITAVLDFEFTNAMPAQFAFDQPWWLLLKQPAGWVRKGEMQKFQDLSEPRKEQFIRAMERAEAKSPTPAGQPWISARMRDWWDSGRFWLNLASRKSFDVDEIYWEALSENSRGQTVLDEATLAAGVKVHVWVLERPPGIPDSALQLDRSVDSEGDEHLEHDVSTIVRLN